MKKDNKRLLNVRMVCFLALLVAVEVVFSRFLSYNVWNSKVGFNFIPVALAAMLFGPLPAAIAAAVADVIGAVLFPIAPFFPGYTLTAFLGGLTWGFFLYKKQSKWRLLGAVAVRQVVLSTLLNTYWISFTYGSPYFPLLATRLVQLVIMSVLEFVIVGILMRLKPQFEKVVKK